MIQFPTRMSLSLEKPLDFGGGQFHPENSFNFLEMSRVLKERLDQLLFSFRCSLNASSSIQRWLSSFIVPVDLLRR